MDFALIAEAFPKIMAGVDETLLLAFSALILGFCLAIPVALMNVSQYRLVRATGGRLCLYFSLDAAFGSDIFDLLRLRTIPQWF